ncbi:MAG: YeeE/YedE family protein [Cyclobacteriaceae bacterium]|nr:YeeE/YedE family protein [Cyclobacteriaceae bacterium]MCK5280602.1 YeeE/YedE family protein [Cyclobacteriaceae bacterium]MCK5470192.1 YeeE/YedE family protein [Cyclobacteriaceae bacterium]MCK5700905.1 YeeE/YedE family protein [Cyclobacteriaceae bacterium]
MKKEDVNMRPYMNPYLAGFLLGILLLITIYITGRGLGASGGIKAVVLLIAKTFQPHQWENGVYFQQYAQSHAGNPLNTWLFFEIIGVVIGAFYSGLISNRVGFRIDRGFRITNKTRLLMAGLGGILFGLGSQLGRGCTSGAALSGMAVMSFGGILTMIAIFGSAYMVAYFFRKFWI